jgi:hypothetical protein
VIARVLGGIAVLAVLASAGPGQTAPETGAASPRAEGRSRVHPAPPDVDLLTIRNIFRYGDEPGVAIRPGGAESSAPAPRETPLPPPARVRIVGLVDRAGTRVAALVIDGEVVLLREDESALGFTVLGIRDEAIRLRDPEGNETTLDLP